MIYVAQEHEYGCAVACVATILNSTYYDALELFSAKWNAVGTGFYCSDIVRAFKRAGKSYSYYYIKPHKTSLIYAEDTIVFVKRSLKYPAGHYLARKNYKWVDPWINFPSFPITSGPRISLPGIPIYALQPQNSK